MKSYLDSVQNRYFANRKNEYLLMKWMKIIVRILQKKKNEKRHFNDMNSSHKKIDFTKWMRYNILYIYVKK